MLLHSIATRGAVWAPQWPIWSERFRILVPDMPGHGETPTDASIDDLDRFADGVARLLDQLGIEQVALVGLSLGGMVAQGFALRHSGRLSALVLAHTMARVSPAGRDAWAARKHAAIDGGMSTQSQSTLERWFTSGFARSAPMTLQWVRQMIETTPLDGYLAAANAIQQLDYLDRLSDIAVPTLVMTGEHDHAATPSLAAEIHARLPSARLFTLAGAAHLGNVERPIEFTEVVGGFLVECLSTPNRLSGSVQ